MFLRVETQWPCVAPHGQGNCPGTLIVVSDGTTHSIACGKCSLGTVGAGPLPEFWITRLIDQGYLRQLARIPIDKEALSTMLGPDWFKLSKQEIVDLIFEHFEVFHKGDVK